MLLIKRQPQVQWGCYSYTKRGFSQTEAKYQISIMLVVHSTSNRWGMSGWRLHRGKCSGIVLCPISALIIWGFLGQICVKNVLKQFEGKESVSIYTFNRRPGFPILSATLDLICLTCAAMAHPKITLSTLSLTQPVILRRYSRARNVALSYRLQSHLRFSVTLLLALNTAMAIFLWPISPVLLPFCSCNIRWHGSLVCDVTILQLMM